MTAQQLIELTLEQSPLDKAGIAEIYLQNALTAFCQRTLILRAKADLTLQGEQLEHEVTDPDDIIRIRELSYNGTKLVNTDAPQYLREGNGFWYVPTSAPLTLYLGQARQHEAIPFPDGATLTMRYARQARPFATDADGAEDYSAAPEIPELFHEALSYRACEKANIAHPDMRRYWHALWASELKKGVQFANEMYTDAEWNPKIYTL